MLDSFSSSEEALRDTLITKATDWAFDELCVLFGFERPTLFSQNVWRNALRVVAYGHRGTLGCTWAALELGLRDSPEADTRTGTLSTSAPNVFTLYNPPVTSFFDCKWIGRFVRIRYALDEGSDNYKYVSKVLYTISGVAPDEGEQPSGYIANTYNKINFAPVETAYWKTEKVDDPLWSNTANTSKPPVVTLELLPFVMNEPSPGPFLTSGPSFDFTYPLGPTPGPFDISLGDECLVEVLVDHQQLNVPATYLLDPDIDPNTGQFVTANLCSAASDPHNENATNHSRFTTSSDVTNPSSSSVVTQPYDGHIMDQFGAIAGQTSPAPPAGTGEALLEAGDPLGEGPHPIYFTEHTSVVRTGKYFDPILAAGIELVMKRRDFCAFEGGYTA